MKKKFLFVLCLGTSLLLGGDTKQDEMIEDLSTIKYKMSVRYAPQNWKNTLFDWDLNTEYQKAQNDIFLSNAQSSDDYQKILKNFFSSTKDYHVGPVFYTREMSLFPILVTQAQGRYFITAKDFSFDLSEEDFLLLDADAFSSWVEETNQAYESNQIDYEIGDEILTINGIAVDKVVEDLIDSELGGSRSPTDYSLATSMLFKRMGKYGQQTPQGNFEIVLQRRGVKSPISFTATWLHFSEDLLKRNMTNYNLNKNLQNIHSIAEIKKVLRKDYKVAIAQDLISKKSSKLHFKKESLLFSTQEDQNLPEYVKSFLPDLGRVIWKVQDDSPIYAYIYKNRNGKKIGYLYLPSFSFYDDEMEDNAITAIANILTTFNKKTDALVFDITNNPGGSSYVMNTLLSMLTSKPIKVFLEQEVISQQEVYNALVVLKYLEYLKESEEYKENKENFSEEELENIKEYFSTIVETFKNGKTLTDPLYLFGEKEIYPNSTVVYQKPFLVLINELDFSCGDFFPAMIQDNKLGKLFGKKTAGAGGYVLFHPYSSSFGVAGFSLTGSIGYRFDGSPIENLGVKPDIPYELTVKDLQSNYQDYIHAVNTEVNKLLKK